MCNFYFTAESLRAFVDEFERTNTIDFQERVRVDPRDPRPPTSAPWFIRFRPATAYDLAMAADTDFHKPNVFMASMFLADLPREGWRVCPKPVLMLKLHKTAAAR